MLALVAGFGIGMVAGIAAALTVMIYLKGQGYGLQVAEAPATAGRIAGLQNDMEDARHCITDLQDKAKKMDIRLDALAQVIVEQDLDKKPIRYAPESPTVTEEKPTGLVEAE